MNILMKNLRSSGIAVVLSVIGICTPMIWSGDIAYNVSPLSIDCSKVYQKVYTEVMDDQDRVLEIVDQRSREHEDCVCEVVRAAIKAAGLKEGLPLQIQMTAIHAVPEHEEAIKSCVLALISVDSTQSSGKKTVVFADEKSFYVPPFDETLADDPDFDVSIVPPPVMFIPPTQPAPISPSVARRS